MSTVAQSGFAALDAELPGGGWPCHALTEVLQPQATVAEWRLLGPAMRVAVAKRQPVIVVGPPKAPHLPGLRLIGLDERQLIWIQAEAPAERLWEMFRGTLTQTSVYPREVVKEALALNAAAVFLAHNHPSGGVCKPSRADELLTKVLQQSLALVDVRVVDHLVVSATSAVSFAERGLI